ncbi:hypothetical protein HYDPIDRAFT_25748 [Hydnomerulius pinastri MD-312]|nr:hypothetical protein HYDPIDRAFT_25748 [Hydnomerulius pinastri MD-312]
MSTSNNASKGKSVPPTDDLMKWADIALAENDFDDEALAARKFQERQRCRAEKKQEEERRAHTWVWSPEMEDDEEDKDEGEDTLRLIVKAINGLTQEVKEMRQEYREQGKRVVAAIDDLQHTLDPEYVAGPEEELDLEVPEEEVAEASAELGELRKEAEAAAEETEDEESDDEEV